jgi:hypothetical protein
VALHDRLAAMGWLSNSSRDSSDYTLTPNGIKALASLGIDLEATRSLRRRFAFPCLDWSERRPHLGGALAAALLLLMLKKKWVTQELDSRALRVTAAGRREFESRLGVRI